MWFYVGQPFRAAAGLPPGAPRTQRTLATQHKPEVSASLYNGKLNKGLIVVARQASADTLMIQQANA